jgi:cell wall-associated NlpC family hydrolase
LTIITPRRILATALAAAALTVTLPGAGFLAAGAASAAPSSRTLPTFPLTVDGDPLAAVAGTAYRSLAWSLEWGTGAESLQYAALRDRVATEVADRIGVPAELLVERWAGATVERQLALLAGLSQLGVPYRRMQSQPGVGFDCSGFTSYAWRMAGRDLPRTSRDQMRASETRDAFTAEPGDLVYFPGHVMLSLGLPGAVVHSPQPGRTVEVQVFDRRLQYADPTV